MGNFVVVIPSRYASVRLPGKPLRMIAGEPMIRHVHRVATSTRASEVWIATDDERIEEAARAFGANVCMTSPDHQSGTDRLAEVCEINGWPDDLVIVNLQGDEPLMPPALVDQCAALLDDGAAGMATLASKLSSQADYENPNVVKVVLDRNGDALYFSRSPIPHSRDDDSKQLTLDTALRHHGIYAYRRDVLRQLVATEPCDLEKSEKLEQLRALWLGIGLRVGIAATAPGVGVDTEEDLIAAGKILESEQK
jgi:3-deoxy-manno-octulosonate cytidylyltransferase (CMP-KDO synthetase)